MAVIYVALGANLGDRLTTLQHALRRLRELGPLEAASPVFETDPVGYRDQPAFLNAAARLQTDLSPTEVIARLLAIERDLGRERTCRNAPRRLDLDLLFYDDMVSDEPSAMVPHPRLHERRFVLAPLAAIAPDLVHPVYRQSVAQLLARLPADNGVRLYRDKLEPTPELTANPVAGDS